MSAPPPPPPPPPPDEDSPDAWLEDAPRILDLLCATPELRGFVDPEPFDEVHALVNDKARSLAQVRADLASNKIRTPDAFQDAVRAVFINAINRWFLPHPGAAPSRPDVLENARAGLDLFNRLAKDRLLPTKRHIMEAEDLALCRKALDELIALGPVSYIALYTRSPDNYPGTELPNYHEAIAEPMWFAEIVRRLELFEYSSAKLFVKDVTLLLQNIIDYGQTTYYSDPLGRLSDDDYHRIHIGRAEALFSKLTQVAAPRFGSMEPLLKDGKSSVERLQIPAESNVIRSKVSDGMDPEFAKQTATLKQMIERIVNKKSTLLFRKPVDRSLIPAYYDVIAEPMDFQTLKERLNVRGANPFRSFQEFERACGLIFSNCRAFNPKENPANAKILKDCDEAEALLAAELVAFKAASATMVDVDKVADILREAEEEDAPVALDDSAVVGGKKGRGGSKKRKAEDDDALAAAAAAHGDAAVAPVAKKSKTNSAAVSTKARAFASADVDDAVKAALTQVLERFEAEFDVEKFFCTPVDTKAVQGYAKIIKRPMDIGTVAEKLEKGAYSTVGDVLNDVELVWNNCIKFNSGRTEDFVPFALSANLWMDDHLAEQLTGVAQPQAVPPPEQAEDSAGHVPHVGTKRPRVSDSGPLLPPTPLSLQPQPHPTGQGAPGKKVKTSVATSTKARVFTHNTLDKAVKAALAEGLNRFQTEFDEDKFFCTPVDTKMVKGYTAVIKRPMDIGIVAKKLEEGAYSTVGALLDDVELVWSNCVKFNGGKLESLVVFAMEAKEWMDDELETKLMAVTTPADPPAPPASTEEHSAGLPLASPRPGRASNRPHPGKDLTGGGATTRYGKTGKRGGQAASSFSSDMLALVPSEAKVKKAIEAAIEALKTLDYAYLFMAPVNLPGYTDIITDPEDLGTILQSLKKFATVGDVVKRVQLVWDNARVFNEHASEMLELVDKLSSALDKLLVEKLSSCLGVSVAPGIKAEVQAMENKPTMGQLSHPVRGHFKAVCTNLLKFIKEKDTDCFFQAPVDVDEIKGYLDVISTPMDFGTVAAKLKKGDYQTLGGFYHDVCLVWSNCLKYNDRVALAYQAAVKLEALVNKRFCDDVRKAEMIPVAPQLHAAAASHHHHPLGAKTGSSGGGGAKRASASAVQGKIQRSHLPLTFRDPDSPFDFSMPKKALVEHLLETPTAMLLHELISRFQRVYYARQYFGVPVIETLATSEAKEEYQRVVETPMDLETIINKLLRGDYLGGVEDLSADFHLMFENSRRYCSECLPDDKDVPDIANHLSEFWEDIRYELDPNANPERKAARRAKREALVHDAPVEPKTTFHPIQKLTTTSMQRDYGIFMVPVNTSVLPTYTDIVKEPMDLGTILQRCKRNEFKTYGEFAHACRLVPSNCLKFNDRQVEGNLCEMADKISEIFENEWADQVLSLYESLQRRTLEERMRRRQTGEPEETPEEMHERMWRPVYERESKLRSAQQARQQLTDTSGLFSDDDEGGGGGSEFEAEADDDDDLAFKRPGSKKKGASSSGGPSVRPVHRLSTGGAPRATKPPAPAPATSRPLIRLPAPHVRVPAAAPSARPVASKDEIDDGLDQETEMQVLARQEILRQRRLEQKEQKAKVRRDQRQAYRGILQDVLSLAVKRAHATDTFLATDQPASDKDGASLDEENLPGTLPEGEGLVLIKSTPQATKTLATPPIFFARAATRSPADSDVKAQQAWARKVDEWARLRGKVAAADAASAEGGVDAAKTETVEIEVPLEGEPGTLVQAWLVRGCGARIRLILARLSREEERLLKQDGSLSSQGVFVPVQGSSVAVRWSGVKSLACSNKSESRLGRRTKAVDAEACGGDVRVWLGDSEVEFASVLWDGTLF